jgi:hypothetical protein
MRPKDWPAHKKSGEYLFQQVPKASITFEDGSNFDLFQSLTIFRYFARKAGMYHLPKGRESVGKLTCCVCEIGLAGEGEVNQAHVEMLTDAVEDIRQKFVKVCYSPDFEQLKVTYLADTVPVEFGKIENVLQLNGTGYLVGGEVPIAHSPICPS